MVLGWWVAMVEVISRPVFMVAEGERAELISGQEIPVRVTPRGGKAGARFVEVVNLAVQVAPDGTFPLGARSRGG
ncbi:MAG: type II and III secretion system protein [Myxococcales bacterium]|nr:type II and III secretion system protein [Myxococcales bacterium]